MTSTKEPLKHSLAAKKKVAPKLKNVLAQPLPRYWPEISESDCEELKECFIKAKENADKGDVVINLGTASCLRLLNRGAVSCLLLSTEIRPKFIITQIIYCIISKNDGVAVLCVPNLKKLTGDTFKIQSLVLAVPKGKQSNLEEWVRKKYSNFPLPEKLVSYYAAKSSLDDPISACSVTKASSKVQPADEMIDFSQLYLSRTGQKGSRAFLPENAVELKPPIAESKDWPEYISLSNNASSVVQMEVDECEGDVEYIKNISKISKGGKKENASQKKSHKDKQSTSANILCQPVPIVALKPKSKEGNPQQNEVKKKKKKNQHKNKGSSITNYISLKVNKIQGNPDKKRKKNNKKK